MLITEIFRNFENTVSDNAKCTKCGAMFTVPEIAERKDSPLACPNCGKPQGSVEAIRNAEDSKDELS